MKKKLLLLFCLVSLFSCDDCNKEEIIPRKGNVVPEEAYLTISNTEIDAKGDGGYHSLKISSNVDWTISDVPEWCETYTSYYSSDGNILIPTLSGSADSTVVLRIKENNTFKKRIANLKIAGNGIVLKLPIIQERRLFGELLDDPRQDFKIYPGLHFDGDFYLNKGTGVKPLIIQGYNEKIRVITEPATITPFKGSPSLVDVSSYINNTDRSKISKIQAKTLISVSELRTGDDFLREENMMLNNPYYLKNAYARVIIDFKKPLVTLDVKPVIVEDEEVKIKLLKECKNPLYVSSVTYGYRMSYIFGVNVDDVDTVVRELNDYIQKGDAAMVDSYVNSLSRSYLALIGTGSPFSLESAVKSAQSESLFDSNCFMKPISWRVKRAISNESM